MVNFDQFANEIEVDKKWQYQAGQLPENWAPLMEDICQIYLPYLSLNTEAFNNGEKYFNHSTRGVEYKNLPVVHYRVWCREELQRHFNELSQGDRLKVTTTLRNLGGRDDFWLKREPQSNWDPDNQLPLCKPKREITFFENIKFYFNGTPW